METSDLKAESDPLETRSRAGVTASVCFGRSCEEQFPSPALHFNFSHMTSGPPGTSSGEGSRLVQVQREIRGRQGVSEQ